MGSRSNVAFPVRSAIAALAIIIALSGPTGFGVGDQSAEAALLSEVKKLLASDGQPSDQFGESVAVSGDTAVVGAFFEGGAGFEFGAAYVFQRNKGGTENWGEVKKLTASDAGFGDWFGGSVAVSGDIVIVGARREDGAGSLDVSIGAAYVFQRDEGGANNWGEVRKLTASDGEAFDWFGVSVAVSGDNAVVGAFFEDAGSQFDDFGAAYVFRRNEGGAENWGEVKKLTASDAQTADNFGLSVAVSGCIAFVGARHEDAEGANAGAAYVFQRDAGGVANWGEVKKLTASDAEAGAAFGRVVAVSGDTAVAGAFGESGEAQSAGAAYVFQRDEGGADSWGEVKKLTASDAEAFDQFGGSVAVSGDTAVVGANSEDAGGKQAGAAYVFQQPPATPAPPPTPPVGGIALDPDLSALAGAAKGGTLQNLTVLLLLLGAGAGAFALAGVAWFMRRRLGGRRA